MIRSSSLATQCIEPSLGYRRPVWEKQSAKQTTFTSHFSYLLYSLWLFSLPFPISFYVNGDKWVAVTRLSLLEDTFQRGPLAGSSWLFILWFDCANSLQHLDNTRSPGFIWPYRPLNMYEPNTSSCGIHSWVNFFPFCSGLSHRSQCAGWALVEGKNIRQLLGFASK